MLYHCFCFHTATVEETGNDDKECNTNQSENNTGKVINTYSSSIFELFYYNFSLLFCRFISVNFIELKKQDSFLFK